MNPTLEIKGNKVQTLSTHQRLNTETLRRNMNSFVIDQYVLHLNLFAVSNIAGNNLLIISAYKLSFKELFIQRILTGVEE